MAALLFYPALLSSRRIVVVRCKFKSAVTLVAVIRCFLPKTRSNARRFLSVSLQVRPVLFRFLEIFPCFLNSVIVLEIEALEKPSSSAVLVTEAPAIQAPTI